MQAHFATDNSKINSNIQKLVSQLDLLEMALPQGKQTTQTALNLIPTSLPRFFLATKTEDKEHVAMLQESFNAEWAQLRARLQAWVNE